MALKIKGIVVLLQCFSSVKFISAAVPASRSVSINEPLYSTNSIKNNSVCWTDDVAYNNQDIVPGAGPCEQCVCNAPDIVCSIVKCEVKAGCKIIQKQNQCCPDYKCECEYNGRMYNNGEKIDTSDMPCRVCYCKGGDVMCTTVGCYEREDCEGKIVPGTCCPKYDHCPPLGAPNKYNRMKQTITDAITRLNGRRGLQPWLLTTDSANTADSINELTTTNVDMNYNTESTPPPEKPLTIILKRIEAMKGNSGTQITEPESTNTPQKISSQKSQKVENDFVTTEGVTEQIFTANTSNVASEALNTIKTSTNVVAGNIPSFTENIIIPYRKEADDVGQETGLTNTSKCPHWSASPTDELITVVFTDTETTERSQMPVVFSTIQGSEISSRDTFADVAKSTIDIVQQLLEVKTTIESVTTEVSKTADNEAETIITDISGSEQFKENVVTESAHTEITSDNYVPEKNLTIRTVVLLSENGTNESSSLDEDEVVALVTLVEKRAQQMRNSENSFVQTGETNIAEENFSGTNALNYDSTTNTVVVNGKTFSPSDTASENIFFESAKVSLIDKDLDVNGSVENLGTISTRVKVVEPTPVQTNTTDEISKEKIDRVTIVNFQNVSSNLESTMNQSSTDSFQENFTESFIVALIKNEENVSGSWEDRGVISAYVRVAENDVNTTGIYSSEESMADNYSQNYTNVTSSSEEASQSGSFESVENDFNVTISSSSNSFSAPTTIILDEGVFSPSTNFPAVQQNVNITESIEPNEKVIDVDFQSKNISKRPENEQSTEFLKSNQSESAFNKNNENDTQYNNTIKVTVPGLNELNLGNNTSNSFQIQVTETYKNFSNIPNNDFSKFETVEFTTTVDEIDRSKSAEFVTNDKIVENDSKKISANSFQSVTSMPAVNVSRNTDLNLNNVSFVTATISDMNNSSESTVQETNRQNETASNTLLDSTTFGVVENSTNGSYESPTIYSLEEGINTKSDNISVSESSTHSRSTSALNFSESTTILIDGNYSLEQLNKENVKTGLIEESESTSSNLDLSTRVLFTLAPSTDLVSNENNVVENETTTHPKTQTSDSIFDNLTKDAENSRISLTNLTDTIGDERIQNSNLTFPNTTQSSLPTTTESKPLESVISTKTVTDTSSSNLSTNISDKNVSPTVIPSPGTENNTELFSEMATISELNFPSTVSNQNFTSSKPAPIIGSLQESNFTEIFSQKFVAHPIKLINTVNSVYMSPGLGYRDQPSSTPRNEIPTNSTSGLPFHETSNSEIINTVTESIQSNETNTPEDEKRRNITLPNYKILLDSLMGSKVKPLNKVPNITVIPLTWLKGSMANFTNHDINTTMAITSGTVVNISSEHSARSNQESNSTETPDVDDAAQNNSLKNESRQEPAQAKVYDPLMPYPEEYPEEYQTIQNGPAIIITRTTYTRIPDVTYTTVTMATLPTYQQVQKAEEGFTNTLFERKFHERSFPNDGDQVLTSSSTQFTPSNDNSSYFNIGVKKIDEHYERSKNETQKNTKPASDQKLGNNAKMDNQKAKINTSRRNVNAKGRGEDVSAPMLDEKDMKIVQNFMNKNLRLR